MFIAVLFIIARTWKQPRELLEMLMPGFHAKKFQFHRLGTSVTGDYVLAG